LFECYYDLQTEAIWESIDFPIHVFFQKCLQKTAENSETWYTSFYKTALRLYEDAQKLWKFLVAWEKLHPIIEPIQMINLHMQACSYVCTHAGNELFVSCVFLVQYHAP